MPKYNHPNLGDVVRHVFLVGTIDEVKADDDTATVSGQFSSKSGVPLFYHCPGATEKRDNGAISGAAAAFISGDEVIVMCRVNGPGEFEPVRVMGFLDGPHTCFYPLWADYGNGIDHPAINLWESVTYQNTWVPSFSTVITQEGAWSENFLTDTLHVSAEIGPEKWGDSSYVGQTYYHGPAGAMIIARRVVPGSVLSAFDKAHRSEKKYLVVDLCVNSFSVTGQSPWGWDGGGNEVAVGSCGFSFYIGAKQVIDSNEIGGVPPDIYSTPMMANGLGFFQEAGNPSWFQYDDSGLSGGYVSRPAVIYDYIGQRITLYAPEYSFNSFNFDLYPEFYVGGQIFLNMHPVINGEGWYHSINNCTSNFTVNMDVYSFRLTTFLPTAIGGPLIKPVSEGDGNSPDGTYYTWYRYYPD